MDSILDHHSSRLQQSLNLLAGFLHHTKSNGRPGVVFLLGAGCSMQYGLPGFHELLSRVCYDLHGKKELENPNLDTLRRELDYYWKNEEVDRKRAILRKHLGYVKGRDCPGYRRLANLMKEGMVHATITMNFDSLLEEACECEGFSSPPIHKIHGSLREDGEEPVISIEESEFYLKPKAKRLLKELLLQN